MGFRNQLVVLSWKNFTLRRRQPGRLMVEIILPLCLFLFLVFDRFQFNKDLRISKQACHYNPRAMPSAGTIPLLQSYVCELNNNCNNNYFRSKPGVIKFYNSSLIGSLFNVMEEVLATHPNLTFLNQLDEEIQLIAQMTSALRSHQPNGTGKGNPTSFSQLLDFESLRKWLSKPSRHPLPGNITDNALPQTDIRSNLKQIPELLRVAANLFEASLDIPPNISDVLDQMCDDQDIQDMLETRYPDAIKNICDGNSSHGEASLKDLLNKINTTVQSPEVIKILQRIPDDTLFSAVEGLLQFMGDIQQLSSWPALYDAFQALLMDFAQSESSMDWFKFLHHIFCAVDKERHQPSDNGETGEKPAKQNHNNSKIHSDPKSLFVGFQTFGKASAANTCAEMFAALESNSGIRPFWHQVKPMVLGLIPFTPDSPAAHEIIREASRTFDSVHSFQRMALNISSRLTDIKSFMKNNNDYLKAFLDMDLFKAVSSDSPYTWEDVMNDVASWLSSSASLLSCFPSNKFVAYPDEESLVNASLKLHKNRTFWAAIVFDNINSSTVETPTTVKYRIRMQYSHVDRTNYIKDQYWHPGPRGYPPTDMRYFLYGFIYIQDMIEHAIIRLHINMSQEPGVYTQQMPYPCWTFDRFVFVVSWNLPLFMVVSWIYSVAMIIKGIVYEKERRLKEVMKMMGLSNGVHWVAWFINAFVIMLITILALCLILKYGQILEYSDPSIVFIFLLAYVVSTISMCFLISVFFNKANLAAVCGGVIFFILFLPYTQLVQWEENTSTTAKVVASLISNIAMGYGCHYIALHEAQALGIQWHNIDESPMPDDTFSLQTCIIMMFLDAFIYLILTWYIEAVFPGQYGMPRKFYFPFQKSYWLGGISRRTVDDVRIDDPKNNSPNFEEEPPDSVIGVKVRNLRKVYKGGKVAVDGMSINFYEDQITSFLGHNGAGKTTTMSILTGLFPPTSGTAYVYGKNVLTCMDEIRHDLGMCPQHNVLFDLLTVEEHIWFYSKLKGKSEADIKVEMTRMIHDVGLPHKRKEKSKYLSGGMKRKLSVAIAFVGGSKTVILDEPTAGVDPYARRAIWELLLKLKKGRTIILSTHHMDEADVLGDRIAIISQGQVRTVGSSIFLKERFGNGYYLTFAKQEVGTESGLREEHGRGRSESQGACASGQFSTTAIVHTVENTKPDVIPQYHDFKAEDEGVDEGRNKETSSSSFSNLSQGTSSSAFSLPKLTSFLQKFVPNAELVENNSMEVCFRLPERRDHTLKLEKLFEALEHSHLHMGISSYGISDTSLEEVFFKTTDEEDDELLDCSIQNGLEFSEGSEQLLILDDSPDNMHEEIGFNEFEDKKMKGKTLKVWQFIALIIKRFHHVRRSKKGFLSEIILPSALVCVAMIISNLWPPVPDRPPLELQPWMYEPNSGSHSSLSVFYSNDNPYNKRARILEANFLRPPFYGTRCMAPEQHVIDGKPCLQESKVNSAWTSVKGNISQHSPACSCSSGFQQCAKGAGGPKPSQRELLTNDNLLNMTARNVSDWLLKTKDHFLRRRYGGFSFGQESVFGSLNASQVSNLFNPLIEAATKNGSIFYGSEEMWQDVEAALKSAFVQDNAKVWFNNIGWAADVSYMNGLNNLILRSFLPPGKEPKDYGIVGINHPLNVHRDHFTERKMNWVDFTVSMCIIFALSFVPASFVLFLIEERVSNSKHLQCLSGINPLIYWVANSIWDYMNSLIPAFICIFILLAFGNEAYTSARHFPCLLALLLLYGWAINPMMYPFSRVFNVPSSGFVALSCFNMFVGFFTTIVTFILDFFQQTDEDLIHLNNIFKQVFLIFPHYCLGRGLLDLASMRLQSDFYARFDEKFSYNLYDWNVIGRNLFAMSMMGALFIVLNLLIEYKFFLAGLFASKATHDSKVKNDDVDVTKERLRVLTGDAANDILRLEGLTKTFWTPGRKGKMTAVDHLYVGVPKGQCFGLLGVNGAGKTTTFKMLTGDVNVSNGDAYVNQYSISKEMSKASEHIGYCPQFDALDPLLTARELLEFYARVRGVPHSQVKRTANWAIRKLGLSQYADKVSSSYSGGNKRKLSTAIALIGNPPLIFLDEPTTGMDPKAKRFLWDRINNIVKTGHSVILTSHSMEECEALCSRLAIMVNGTFQCIGSIQHLKNRFGNGYSIVLRVRGPDPDVSSVMEFISSCFSSAKLVEKHHNLLQYQLGTEGLSLSHLFHSMEEAKAKHNVESYSVSQTTLDQVFINFAKKQTDMLDYEFMEGVDDDSDVFHHEGNAQPTHQDCSPNNTSDDEIPDFDDEILDGSTIALIQPSQRQRRNQAYDQRPVDITQSSSIL